MWAQTIANQFLHVNLISITTVTQTNVIVIIQEVAQVILVAIIIIKLQ